MDITYPEYIQKKKKRKSQDPYQTGLIRKKVK